MYSGPIGAIITPQFMGVAHEPWLPFASSLCGACAEVCPVKIDIPKLLLELRAEVVEKSEASGSRWERLGFRAFAWLARHPQLWEFAGRAAAGLAPRGFNIGPLKLWGQEREMPTLAEHSFRELWRRRS